jgi:hypothetical protein
MSSARLPAVPAVSGAGSANVQPDPMCGSIVRGTFLCLFAFAIAWSVPSAARDI